MKLLNVDSINTETRGFTQLRNFQLSTPSHFTVYVLRILGPCEDISLVFNQSLETRGIILLKFMFQIIYEQKFFSSPAFVKTRSDLHQFIFKS